MSSKLDELKEYVKQHPGSRWWVEELIFRGAPSDTPGGTVRGACVVLGLEVPSPMPGGDPLRQLTDTLRVGDAPTDVPMGQVLQSLHVSQQNTIEQLRQTVKAKHEEVTALKAKLQQPMPTPMAAARAAGKAKDQP